MKNLFKQFLFILAAIFAAPFTLLYLITNLIFKSDSVFSGFSQLLSLLPTKAACYFRANFYRFTMNYCSQDAVISFLVLFSQQDTEIYSGVYIGPQCNIGKCRIEQDVIIGSGVHIMSGKGQHNFSDISKPIRDQGGVFEKITIGRNSWIGNGAHIMANIGKNCVVAAWAVVINDVEDYSIVAGNPAKVIKKRV